MSAIFHPTRGGTRGGQDQFDWEDVKTDKDRECYLGKREREREREREIGLGGGRREGERRERRGSETRKEKDTEKAAN